VALFSWLSVFAIEAILERLSPPAAKNTFT